MLETLDTLVRIEGTLARVMFAPSCVDMGWRWEAIAIEAMSGTPAGFLIRTTFQRPDRDTGAIERGFGRWWHLPPQPSESAIVKTAYAAARLILEHELMEAFRFDGHRLFDPHHDIEDLIAAALHRGTR